MHAGPTCIAGSGGRCGQRVSNSGIPVGAGERLAPTPELLGAQLKSLSSSLTQRFDLAARNRLLLLLRP